jgi:hypothetical protein
MREGITKTNPERRPRPMRRRLVSACLIALLSAAVAAPVASAANPTSTRYSNGVNQVGGGGGETSAAGAPSSPGPLNSPIVEGLPFTGLDLVALAAVAIALVSLGLVLRRLPPPRPARR